MIRTAFAFLFAAALGAPAGLALAADVKIGYLELADDVRYHPQVAYSRIQISPALEPVEGARMGLADMLVNTDAVGIKIGLDEAKVKDGNEALAKLQAMAAAGERFVILDLPGDIVGPLADAAKGLKLTLMNATAPQNALRDLCLPDLMHAGASDRMITDSYMQFLRHRNWTRVLMIVGGEKRDIEMADSFQQSAQRLGINIVDRRTFTMSTDPANRESNNTALITGGTDYDVVYVADSLGEYARYLDYSTQLPRPVIGSAGLTASEWHWSWDRDGATQVTLRFQRAATGGRFMSPEDYDTWIAAKSIATAYVKARSDDPDKVDAYLRSSRFAVDGSKGYKMNFRSWDGQLREPLVLATSNAVIEATPFPEFLHQTNVLDTLGTDQPESKCQAQ